MKNAELNVVKFGENDVIATSVFTLANTFDGTLNNATVKIDGTTYTNTAVNQTLIDAFNTKFGTDAFKNLELKRSVDDNNVTLELLLSFDSGNNQIHKNDPTSLLTAVGDYNTTWWFNGTNFVKVTQ